MYYRCGSLNKEDFSLEKKEITATTPSIERILIENCTSEDSTSSAAFIVGLPESPIRDLVIRNCSFTVATSGLTPVEESEMYEGLPEPEGRGIRLRNVELSMQDVQVEGVETALVVEDGVQLQS